MLKTTHYKRIFSDEENNNIFSICENSSGENIIKLPWRESVQTLREQSFPIIVAQHPLEDNQGHHKDAFKESLDQMSKRNERKKCTTEMH